MWPGGHRSGLAAVWTALLTVAWAVSVNSPARAQGGEGWPPVGEGHARAAQRLVEQWVQRGGVPGQRAPAIRVTDLVGVRITLRSAGITLGDGTAFRPDLVAALRSAPVAVAGKPLPATDLVSLLERATSRAFTDVMERLEDRALEARVRAAAGGGDDGGPPSQVLRVLRAAGQDAADPEPLGRPGGVPLYRFDALHVVRPRAAMAPVVLVRGGQLLPGRFVGQQMLAGMSERMARNLLGRFIGGQRVRGPYHPAGDRFDPELADEQEAALASLALMRYAREARKRGRVDPLLGRFEDAAAGVVNRLAGRLLTPDDLEDPVIGGLALLAMLDAPAAAFEPALRDRLAAQLADPSDPDAEPRPPAWEAVVAAALAGRYAQSRDAVLGARVAEVLAALWERGEGRFDVFALPWALEAHGQASAPLIEDGLLEPDVAAARGAGLAALLDLVEAKQVIDRPSLGPDDVMGGIVLRAAPEGSPPAPTWHTAHVVRFLALALRDHHAVPAKRRPGVMVTASAAARFLGQLMIDEPSCFGIPNPDQALGGIRLALFDNTLNVAPTAVTLLAVTELSATLHAMDGGGGG